MRHVAACVLLCTAITADLHAVSIRIAADGACRDAVVRAVASCEGRICPEAVSGAPGEVDLAPDFAWNVSATATGCWSETVSLPAGSSRPPAVTIGVWPAAKLSGRIAVPRGEPSPSSAELQIETLPRASTALARTTVACDVLRDRFTCLVPRLPLDVRLSFPGFAPHYAWGVSSPQELGVMALERGASLAGVVAFDARESPAPESVEIEVVPEVLGDVERHAEQRLARRATVIRPNARGFFQVRALEPGSYRIVARRPEWSTARLHDIRVEEERETVLEPIVIFPLAATEVHIEPPRDPRNRPWTVQLRGREGLTRSSAEVASVEADESGVARLPEVESATYLLNVLSGDGVRFAHQVVQIRPFMAPIAIRTTAVELRGRVTMAGEPVPSRLDFQNSDIGGPVGTRTDQHAVFRAILAGEGTWRARVTPEDHGETMVDVAVRRADGKRFAWADIRLPAGRVQGRMVDRNGRPATGFIRLVREKRVAASAAVTEDGAFSFVGLEPGEVEIVADGRAKGRATVPHRVIEGDTAEVTVRIEQAPEIRGWVVTTAGRPVAAAMIQYCTGFGCRDVNSGPSGEFIIPLFGKGEMDLIVIAPGHPIRFLSVPAGDAEDVPVEIVVGGAYGLLDIRMARMPPMVFLRRRGFSRFFVAPLPGVVHRPRGNPERDPDSVGPIYEVEPGEYTVCPSYALTEQCITRVVQPGGRADIDTRAWRR